MKNRVLVTGATGFIGRNLCKELVKKGYEVIANTRDIKRAEKLLPKEVKIVDQIEFDNHYNVIINLMGETIAQRWSKNAKNIIYHSRIDSTTAIVESIKGSKQKPDIFINSSAIGYYHGLGDKKDLDENDINDNPKSFTSKLCYDIEQEAKKVQDQTRLCLLRTGIVLEKDGGTLQKLLPSFKLGLGGKIASGKQSFSWIHRDDLINIILFLIENKDVSGAINATSPNAVSNLEFTKAFGKIINRPTIFTVPGFVLRIIFGQMAQELMIEGQKILPKKLLDNGFKFKLKTINNAMNAIFKK